MIVRSVFSRRRKKPTTAIGAAAGCFPYHREREPGKLRAHCERLCRVHPGAYAAGGKEMRDRAAQRGEQEGRGYPPVGKLRSHGPLLLGEPVGFHGDPVCAAAACQVHVCGAALQKLADVTGHDAEACLLDDDGQRAPLDQARESLLHAAEIPVTPGLEELLARVQVDGERLHLQSFQQRHELGDAAVPYLYRPDIRDYRHVRSERLQVKVGEKLGRCAGGSGWSPDRRESRAPGPRQRAPCSP